MPFMPPEDLADQDRSVALFEAYDADTGELSELKFAVEHRDIVRRFGRFPAPCSAAPRLVAEQTFLDDGGFAG